MKGMNNLPTEGVVLARSVLVTEQNLVRMDPI